MDDGILKFWLIAPLNDKGLPHNIHAGYFGTRRGATNAIDARARENPGTCFVVLEPVAARRAGIPPVVAVRIDDAPQKEIAP